jgi:hypothetical protein
MPRDGQTDRILAYLRSHPEGLTQMDAYRLGMGTRLAARISEAKDRIRPEETIVAVEEKHEGGIHARYVLQVATVYVEVPLWDVLDCEAA